MNDVLVCRPPSSTATRIRFSRLVEPPRSFARELLFWGLITLVLAGFASLVAAWVANLLE